MEGQSLALDVRNASKTLRQRPVLVNIHLQVALGECIGIFGPNGAGKSMLLRLISGLIHPDQGSVYVFGRLLGKEIEFPPQLGALIDAPGFLPNRSGFENLALLASIQNRIGRERIVEAMQMVGLDPDDSRPVRTYSTGMKQRLGVAQAIMEYPKLLLLDEPTRGLDPEGAQRIRRLLYDLKQAGTTIVLVSHERRDTEALSDRLFAMYDGRLVSAENMINAV